MKVNILPGDYSVIARDLRTCLLDKSYRLLERHLTAMLAIVRYTEGVDGAATGIFDGSFSLTVGTDTRHGRSVLLINYGLACGGSLDDADSDSILSARIPVLLIALHKAELVVWVVKGIMHER